MRSGEIAKFLGLSSKQVTSRKRELGLTGSPRNKGRTIRKIATGSVITTPHGMKHLAY